MLRGWENDSPLAGLRCCVVLPPTQRLTLLDQGRGCGNGDSPLLFGTLAEVLPAQSRALGGKESQEGAGERELPWSRW